MTAIIKLTLPKCSVYPYDRAVFVNTANITQIYRGFQDDDYTYVGLTSGVTRAVKESPEEILQQIWRAENIKCKP